jgi:hypothetical protein
MSQIAHGSGFLPQVGKMNKNQKTSPTHPRRFDVLYHLRFIEHADNSSILLVFFEPAPFESRARETTNLLNTLPRLRGDKTAHAII